MKQRKVLVGQKRGHPQGWLLFLISGKNCDGSNSALFRAISMVAPELFLFQHQMFLPHVRQKLQDEVYLLEWRNIKHLKRLMQLKIDQ